LLNKELATKQVSRIRAVIADDHDAMRTRIRELIGSLVEVVASVSDGRAALDAIEQHDPDLVLLDISMPELNGIEVARELTRRGSRAKIIFVTLDQSEQMRVAARTAGGAAYIPKAHLDQDLIRTVKSLFNLP
jgi:DNA-binding NarL/FixJ family response regulator